MEITGKYNANGLYETINSFVGEGAFYRADMSAKVTSWTYVSSSDSRGVGFQASRAWTGTTNTAQPQTVNLGSGQALDITPSYYTCHMWLRLT